MKPKPCFILFSLLLCCVPSPAQPDLADEIPRKPTNDEDLEFWLETMVWDHGYSTAEIRSATGLSKAEIAAAKKRFEISPGNAPEDADPNRLKIRPFPGGRHPRIGFLEGAVRPQRETKVSVFTPWEDGHGHVVVDVPEAIWSNLGLTYLAHTHVETIWTRDNIALAMMEWNRHDDGSLSLERKLPNGIAYRARVMPRKDHVEMILELDNGTDALLTDLRVQNCVMLKNAPGFTDLTNDNKRFEAPFAVAQSTEVPQRWIITAWEPCHRPWGNARVPCLHSDPRFPDCPPGGTSKVKGWLSFYDGDDLDGELARIRKQFWLAERRVIPQPSLVHPRND